MDVLPKGVHTPEASKPAEAFHRLNKLFNIKAELKPLFSPDPKKKNVLSARNYFARLFDRSREKCHLEIIEIETFKNVSLCVK